VHYGQARIECRFENESIWLTQALMAELFQVTPQNVTMHIKAIYDEGELDKAATCKDYLQVRKDATVRRFRIVRTEGSRQVARQIEHYSLPVILSVGYRVRSRRGTRLFDGKDYFTVYDFVKAYEHFNDPEWDGEPAELQPVEPRTEEDANKVRELPETYEESRERPSKPQTIKIKLADGKERTIQHMMATSFWSPDGKPMSATQFMERLFGDLPDLFKDEDELRKLWSRPDTRQKLLDGLAEKGYGKEQLAELTRLIDAEKSDLYDVLAYVAFAFAPISRQERVSTHRKLILASYGANQRDFLAFVLDHYIQQGVEELAEEKLPILIELKYQALRDAIDELGEAAAIREVFIGFQKHLYARQAVV